MLSEVIHLYILQCLIHSFSDFLWLYPKVFRTEGHIFLYYRSNHLVVRILKNHPCTFSHFPGVLWNASINAVDVDFSALRQKKCIHMFCKGGFPRTVMSKDHKKLPFLHDEIHTLQGIFLFTGGTIIII